MCMLQENDTFSQFINRLLSKNTEIQNTFFVSRLRREVASAIYTISVTDRAIGGNSDILTSIYYDGR